jgi:hypothetical protein
MMHLTLIQDGQNDGVEIFTVKRGVTFLATIDFAGPRHTIRTHHGALHADERKEVYRLYAATQKEAR